jgi:hypothetical protein
MRICIFGVGAISEYIADRISPRFAIADYGS